MRAPDKQFPIVFSQLIVGCIVQCSCGTIVGAEMAKATSSVPVLWEALLRVLRILFRICDRNHGYASFGTDPGADAATRALFHIEEVSSAEAFRQHDSLVRVLHCESAFEDVFDSFIHCLKYRASSLRLTVGFHGPVVQAAVDDWHVSHVDVSNQEW